MIEKFKGIGLTPDAVQFLFRLSPVLSMRKQINIACFSSPNSPHGPHKRLSRARPDHLPVEKREIKTKYDKVHISMGGGHKR